jgi:hypothetical protein
VYTRLFTPATLLAAFAALAAAGCGSEGSTTCIENETKVCDCPGGKQGVQTCTAEGIYSQCDCGGNGCDPGFREQNGECVDIDECTAQTDNCDDNATCQNNEGGFSCSCNTGYAGDGVTCSDIDECSQGTHDCDANAACSDTDGSFTCTCNQGWEGDGRSCTDVDECALDIDGCDQNAACTNTPPGSFTCTCGTGYDGDGFTCTNIDECTAGTHDCGANATCTDDDPGFHCDCNEGYTGDGHTCDPDVDTMVADVSDRPIPVEIDGIGTVTITGLSRVGWDIEAIETPLGGGRTHKDPGLVLVPEITMRGVTGTETAVNGLKTWIEQGAGAVPRNMIMTLTGLGAEEAQLYLYSPKPVAGDTTITQDGSDYVLAEMVIELGPAPVVPIGLGSYTEPDSGNYPPCALPGHSIDISGVTNSSCWPSGVLDVPAPDTSDPIYLPGMRNGQVVYDWMHQFTDYWLNDGLAERRDMSVIERDASGAEVGRINMFQIWPARYHIFNPTRPYGYSYLFDMLIVTDLAEQAIR